MRSSRSTDRTEATRAAIRDAAVARFAADGLDAPLRAVAEDARVSPALIVHHFGSKDGLRAECDRHVLAVVAEQKAAALAPDHGPTAARAALAALDELAPVVGYTLRAIQAGGETARIFIDSFADDAQRWLTDGVAGGVLRPSRDEQARARYLTLIGFGAMLLDMRLHPPADPTDLTAAIRGYIERHGLASIELFTEGLYTDHRMLDAYLMYVTDPPAQAGP